MRIVLPEVLPAPAWPAGVHTGTFEWDLAPRLHALLEHAHRHGTGSVPPYDAWLSTFTEDDEFDAELCFLVFAGEALVGAALCWTSAFVKDLVVHEVWRGRGLGEALLRRVFQAFRARGAPAVELKTRAHNHPALRLYARVGMVPVDRISEP